MDCNPYISRVFTSPKQVISTNLRSLVTITSSRTPDRTDVIHEKPFKVEQPRPTFYGSQEEDKRLVSTVDLGAPKAGQKKNNVFFCVCTSDHAIYSWLVLSDEQMSNWVGVKHLPDRTWV